MKKILMLAVALTLALNASAQSTKPAATRVEKAPSVEKKYFKGYSSGTSFIAPHLVTPELPKIKADVKKMPKLKLAKSEVIEEYTDNPALLGQTVKFVKHDAACDPHHGDHKDCKIIFIKFVGEKNPAHNAQDPHSKKYMGSPEICEDPVLPPAPKPVLFEKQHASDCVDQYHCNCPERPVETPKANIADPHY